MRKRTQSRIYVVKTARSCEWRHTKPNLEGNIYLRNNTCHQQEQQLEISRKDKVPNFWQKNLISIYQDLANAYKNVIENPGEMLTWFTQGITYLLLKSEDTKDPKNYQPVTCLPKMYKILTSVIIERTYSFLHEHQLLPIEQTECRCGSYGCKEQLLINKDGYWGL